MATGQDIFPVMQACIILSWYFYQEGRWVEVWIFAGFQTRAAIPLRLNYPGTFSAIGAASPGAYLAPPKDFKDLESRRRTWWMTIMFDRIASVGGWVHAIDERDIGTELPLRRVDFENEVSNTRSAGPCISGLTRLHRRRLSHCRRTLKTCSRKACLFSIHLNIPTRIYSS